MSLYAQPGLPSCGLLRVATAVLQRLAQELSSTIPLWKRVTINRAMYSGVSMAAPACSLALRKPRLSTCGAAQGPRVRILRRTLQRTDQSQDCRPHPSRTRLIISLAGRWREPVRSDGCAASDYNFVQIFGRSKIDLGSTQRPNLPAHRRAMLPCPREDGHAESLPKATRSRCVEKWPCINEDGTVTVRLLGYDIPVSTRGEHLDLIAKKKPDQTTAKLPSDKLRNRAELTRARP